MTYSPNSVCDKLYMLRDAVQRDDLECALKMAREVYEKIVYLVQVREKTNCTLDCSIKDKDDKAEEDI